MSSQHHGKQMRYSASEEGGRQAGHLLEETAAAATTTEHMTRESCEPAPPGALPPPPRTQRCGSGYPLCGHRGARLSSAEEKEREGVKEGGREGRGDGGEKRRERPCVSNDQRSAAAALSTRAVDVVV